MISIVNISANKNKIYHTKELTNINIIRSSNIDKGGDFCCIIIYDLIKYIKIRIFGRQEVYNNIYDWCTK